MCQEKKEEELYGYFKRQSREISTEKTWTWLRKGKFKKETESILITAQNNAIRTNYIKIKIEHTQQDNKCRFCGDRDETNNHIRSECCKLVQKNCTDISSDKAAKSRPRRPEHGYGWESLRKKLNLF